MTMGSFPGRTNSYIIFLFEYVIAVALWVLNDYPSIKQNLIGEMKYAN